MSNTQTATVPTTYRGMLPLLPLLFAVLVLSAFPLAAQDTDATGSDTGTAEEQEATESETEEEQEESLLDRWRETILYGIDSQVEELLPILSSHGETRLNEEIEQLLATSLNPSLRASIFEFFAEVDSEIAVDEATEILEFYRDARPELVRATLSYLHTGEFDLPAATLEALRPIASNPRSGFAAQAARVLGEKGGEDDVETLLAGLDEATDDELRGQIVLALGDIGSTQAVDALLEIAGNDSEPRLLRGYAADSLGRIGDERAVDVLKEMVRAEDAIVRAYAVSSLSRYDDPSVEPTLMAALRDSVWRVRQFALQGVARNDIREAVPAVIYKAEQDPEERVRAEAFETLVRLGGGRARSFVEEYLLDQDNPASDRMAAAQALMEHDLSGSVGVLEKVVEKEWSVQQSQVLGFLARELSRKEEPGLAGLYSRFLTHPEPAVQIFGLRGIGTNRILRMKTRVEEKSDEGNHPAVRQNAEAVLEQL